MKEDIFRMSSQRQMFRPQMSLYIPSVTSKTTEEQIKHVFKMLDLGVVSRVDFVEKDNGNSMAFVHFEYWLLNNSSYHLQERIQTEGQAKIVYNDPYYWIVMENANPRTQAEIQLENRIHGLEERVRYLETVVATHTRKLIDNGICTNGQTCSQCWTVYIEDKNDSTCPACNYNSEQLVVTVTAEGQRKITDYYNEDEKEREEAEALAMTGALGAASNEDVEVSNDQTETVKDGNATQQQSGGWWPFS